MATQIGVGYSTHTDGAQALDEAVTQALSSLVNSSPALCLLFVSPSSYDQQLVLQMLQKKLPHTPIIGCSSAGEITSRSGSIDNSVALALLSSDSIRFVVGKGIHVKENAKDAGRMLAEDIKKEANGHQPRAMILFQDGLHGDGAEVVRGVLDMYGANFMVVGAAAGDDYQFQETYQYINDQVLTDSVVGVGLYGNFSLGVGLRHGWFPIGISRTATKSRANVLYELDGQPAMQLYMDYFGNDIQLSSRESFARLAHTYPLGLQSPLYDGYLIRTPVSVSENGAITVNAEVPEGVEVHIMIGSGSEILQAARDAATDAMKIVHDKKPVAAFMFNNIARKKLLMGKKQEEIDVVKQVIGEIPLFGFCSYGEVGPLAGDIITCSFQNETDVICVLADQP